MKDTQTTHEATKKGRSEMEDTIRIIDGWDGRPGRGEGGSDDFEIRATVTAAGRILTPGSRDIHVGHNHTADIAQDTETGLWYGTLRDANGVYVTETDGLECGADAVAAMTTLAADMAG